MAKFIHFAWSSSPDVSPRLAARVILGQLQLQLPLEPFCARALIFILEHAVHHCAVISNITLRLYVRLSQEAFHAPDLANQPASIG